jgi:hypothetical protein
VTVPKLSAVAVNTRELPVDSAMVLLDASLTLTIKVLVGLDEDGF